MRLTKQLREAFVRAVMTDVPDTTKDLRDQAQAEVYRAELSDLPPEDAAVLMKYRPYFYTGSLYLSNRHMNVILAHRGVSGDDPRFAEAKKLMKQHDAAQDARMELETKLEGVAAACSSVKALHKALPEFAKYIHDDAPTSKNLPALANVVSDFVKAGWPKGKPIATEETV